MAGDGPTIVCLQAGNVNTGACDDLARGVRRGHRHGAWVHVDGAFGLWAAASPRLAHLVAGSSTPTRGPPTGTNGSTFPTTGATCSARIPTHTPRRCRSPRRISSGHGSGPIRAPSDYVPESSRRARGFATWAALRELGREASPNSSSAVARWPVALPTARRPRRRHRRQRRRAQPSAGPLRRRRPHRPGHRRVQRDGTCWMGGTTGTAAAHAHLRVELDDDRGRRRPLGRCDRTSTRVGR